MAEKVKETWKDRLETEFKEVEERLTLLTKALDLNTVPEKERSILEIQFNAMTSYLHILHVRLNK